jgi:hypothetical protein
VWVDNPFNKILTIRILMSLVRRILVKILCQDCSKILCQDSCENLKDCSKVWHLSALDRIYIWHLKNRASFMQDCCKRFWKNLTRILVRILQYFEILTWSWQESSKIFEGGTVRCNNTYSLNWREALQLTALRAVIYSIAVPLISG